MKAMIFIVPIIYLCGNGYLFWKIWQAMIGIPIWSKVLISLLFWFIAFFLFASIGLRNFNIPDYLLRNMFQIGSIWMVFLLYMVLLLIVLDIAKIFISIPGNTLWYSLAITCCLLIYGHINYKNPRIEHIDINLEKKFGGENIKIVSVSDIHLGYGTGLSTLRDYVTLINSKNPDIILISGDLIDNNLKPLLQEPFDKELSKLKAPMGIYMVTGNHEYISGINACSDFLKNTPINMLRDSIVVLPNGIQIIGRDDRSNRKRKQLSDLLTQVDMDNPVIVLDHQPYKLSKVDSLKVDMQLSGHTHHGQIWPLSLVTDHLYEQSHGYRKWNHSHIWVSSGLSLWGPPFRIGTKSDLAVIELHSR